MDTKTIKIFDANNNLVNNFDEVIEEVLISVHGENYYDTDEELINTNLIPVSDYINNTLETDIDKADEEVSEMIQEDAPKVSIVNEKTKKVSFKDFIPVLFFIIMFAIIIFAGFYFLNNVDFTKLLK